MTNTTTASRKKEQQNTTTPYKFDIHPNQSFATLEFDLDPYQSVISNAGAMNFMREGVDRGELSNSGDGGFWSGIGRMFSGQSAFLVKYTGLDRPNRRIAFSAAIPGSILYVVIQPGEELLINRGSFIAGSPNVDISGKLNWRGFFGFGQEEGFVLPKIRCRDKHPGHVWLGSFGQYQRHDIKKNQSILVDNGLFLGSIAKKNKDDPIYTLVTLGKSVFSSSFGGEGFGMEFIGPRIVYTQSHHFGNFVSEVAQLVPKDK